MILIFRDSPFEERRMYEINVLTLTSKILTITILFSVGFSFKNFFASIKRMLVKAFEATRLIMIKMIQKMNVIKKENDQQKIEKHAFKNYKCENEEKMRR